MQHRGPLEPFQNEARKIGKSEDWSAEKLESHSDTTVAWHTGALLLLSGSSHISTGQGALITFASGHRIGCARLALARRLCLRSHRARPDVPRSQNKNAYEQTHLHNMYIIK